MGIDSQAPLTSERRSDAERERKEEVGQTDGQQGHNSSMHQGLPSDDNQSEYASKEPCSGEAAHDALNTEFLAEQAVLNTGPGSSSVSALDMPQPGSAALASAVRLSVPPAVLNSLHNTQAHILKSPVYSALISSMTSALTLENLCLNSLHKTQAQMGANTGRNSQSQLSGG
jgi:hypothetical protein